MGLKLGKAILHDAAIPFCKLSKSSIMKTITAYQQISDGFGLSSTELCQIILELSCDLQLNSEILIYQTNLFFQLLDTDQNQLIDGLELLSLLSLLSGMSKKEIIEFILSLYDFNHRGSLNFDEIVLALKTITYGCNKLYIPRDNEISREILLLPTDEKLESIVSQTFIEENSIDRMNILSREMKNLSYTTSGGTGTGSGGTGTGGYEISLERRNIRELSERMLHIPEILSWLDYFCNYDEIRPILSYNENERRDLMIVPNDLKVSSTLGIDMKSIIKSLDNSKQLLSIQMKPIYTWKITENISNSLQSTSEMVNKVANWSLQYDHHLIDGQSGNQWKTQEPLLVPTKMTDKVPNGSFPPVSIELEWLYGLQAGLYRRNVRTTRSNEVVYTVGKYAIVYDVNQHVQRIMSHHTADISYLEMHPSQRLAATGDDSESPMVIIWDVETTVVSFQTQGLLYGGVSQLSFSPCGEILLMLDSLPCKKTLIAMNWRSQQVVFQDTLDSQAILSATTLNKGVFVVGTDTKLLFWQKQTHMDSNGSDSGSGGYIRRTGLFPKNSPAEAVTALLTSHNGENVICGTVLGKVGLWSGINCVRIIRAHSAAVNAMCICGDGFVSAGADSRVRLWSTSLEPRFLYDISKFGRLTGVLSVSSVSDGTSLVVSTTAADIFEISAIDGSDLRGGPLVKSHAYGAVNGVDLHPSKSEFSTVGADGSLRIVDCETRSLLRMAQLDVEGTCVAYGPLGDIMAIGTANRAGGLSGNSTGNTCMFFVLSEETLQVIHSARDSKHPATVVRFSPEGDTLAVGGADGSIYLYSVHDDFELIGRCSRHTCAITAVDFSSNGEWLRANGVDGDLHFFSSDAAAVQTNVSALRDVEWATQTCPLTWQTRGIHSVEVRNELVTSCAIPPTDSAIAAAAAAAGDNNVDTVSSLVSDVVAVGTSCGQVRLFRYPSIADAPEHFRYTAHSSEVVAVRFSYDGTRLITVGRQDRVVLQWRIRPTSPLREKSITEDNSPGVTSTEVVEALSEVAFELTPEDRLLENFRLRSTPLVASELHERNSGFSTDRFMWSHGIPLPSVPTAVVPAPPDVNLSLQHVYGIETQTLRGHVSYTSIGALIYTAGAYGVVWSGKTTNSGATAAVGGVTTGTGVVTGGGQRVYSEHINRITAFAATMDGNIVATGDMGSPANVRVWDALTGETLFAPQSGHGTAIRALAFSATGRFLAVVSNDRFHTLSVYDWRAGTLLSRSYLGTALILAVTFVDSRPESAVILAVGVKRLAFVRRVTGRFPSLIMASFEDIGRLQTFATAIMFGSDVVTGAADGFLYSFAATSAIGTPTGGTSVTTAGVPLRQTVKAHNGLVTSLSVSGGVLASGGVDGVVRLWDGNFGCLREVSLSTFSKSSFVSVRAVALSKDGNWLAIATSGAELFEVGVRDGELRNTPGSDGVVVSGHANGWWGLAMHPTNAQFASVGDDGMLRLWDANRRTVTKSLRLDVGSRAVSYSADGAHLLVGLGTGKRVKGRTHAKEGGLVVLTADHLRVVVERKDTNEFISAIAFDPTNKVAAVGANDGSIWVYNVSESYSLRYSVSPHSATVRQIDFSNGAGEYFVSWDSANRLAYTSILNGVMATSPDDTTNERWIRGVVPLSWGCLGLWKVVSAEEGTPYDVDSTITGGGLLTASANSHNGNLVVAANQDGDVYVSRWPAAAPQAFLTPGRQGTTISSIGWLSNDHAFLTVASGDCTAVQWRLLGKDRSHVEPPPIRPDGRRSVIAGSDGVEDHKIVCDWRPTTEDAEEGSRDVSPFPWRGVICEPSKLRILPADLKEIPPITISHIHGWQRGARASSVFYNSDGHAVYAAGNVGIRFDRHTLSQATFTGHTTEVTAITATSSGDLVASGDRQRHAEVYIWDALVATPRAKISGAAANAVAALAFSADSHTLVVVGDDVWHSVSVVRSLTGLWNDAMIVKSFATGEASVHWALHASYRPSSIVLGCGDGFLRCYDVSSTVTTTTPISLAGATALVGAVMNNPPAGGTRIPAALTCGIHALVHIDTSASGTTGNESQPLQTIAAGSADGFVFFVTAEGQIAGRLSAHDGAVTAIIQLTALAGRLVTVGTDRKFKIWNSNLSPFSNVSLDNLFVSTSGYGRGLVTTLAYCPSRATLLLGMDGTGGHGSATTGPNIPCGGGGDLMEMSVLEHSRWLLSEGHHNGGPTVRGTAELHGIAFNPLQPSLYATAGDDGVLRVWHYDLRYCIARLDLRFPCRALTWSSDGVTIAAGFGCPGRDSTTTKDGTVALLRWTGSSVEMVREERKAKKAVSDIAFSPDGKRLAVSSFDSRVYVLDSISLITIAIIAGDIGSAPTNALVNVKRSALRVDWNRSGTIIRVAYAPDRLLFYNVDHQEHETNPTRTRDLEWSSTSVPFSWLVQGLHPLSDLQISSNNDDDIHGSVTAISIHPSERFVLAAYSSGEVRLATYPCVSTTKTRLITRMPSYASRMIISSDGNRMVLLDAITRIIVQIDLPSQS